jgi:catechol 2,3-dioxygenase-like lactoylglutathione lyase family enzyme
MTELGDTPGVYICWSCALWAARRASRFPIISLDPRRLARRLLRRGHSAGVFWTAIPILPSTDLDRTAAYYESVGLHLIERSEGYLRLHSGSVELHFSTAEDARTPGEAFVHVPDAGRLWKRLRSEGVTGLGPVEDQPWGLREFVLTDPDGNRLRVGSAAPPD